MQSNRNRLNYYAKILIFISIALLGYGLVLDINNSKRLLNPVTDVIPIREEESTISITTADGNEVVPGNKITKTKDKDKDKNQDTSKDNDSTTNTTPSDNTGASSGNNSGGEYVNNTPAPAPAPITPPSSSVHIPTLDEANNALRNSIQSTYGINIRYGSETYGYSVGGFSTTPIDNSTTINAALNRLKNVFNLYPKGFFNEIKNGGIPLTVILINNYSESSITGVTDSSYTYANISIALAYPFEESFYHESYHYIERYMFKKGANFNSWSILNPVGFSYGTIVNNYSYDVTFSESVPFVNNYAQTSDTEDRASTFEYMMAETKASCLNHGNPVWQKANLMKNTIEAVFSTVSPSTTEYWERYV